MGTSPCCSVHVVLVVLIHWMEDSMYSVVDSSIQVEVTSFSLFWGAGFVVDFLSVVQWLSLWGC